MQRVNDVWQVEVYGYRCPECEKLCKISGANFGNHSGIDGKTALVGEYFANNNFWANNR